MAKISPGQQAALDSLDLSVDWAPTPSEDPLEVASVSPSEVMSEDPPFSRSEALTRSDGSKSSLMAAPTEISEMDLGNFLAQAARLSTMKPTLSLTPTYFDFTEIGTVVRGIYLGFKEIRKKDEDGDIIPIKCIQWIGEDSEVYLNGGVALISTFESTDVPIGTPIEIEYSGKRGRTKLFNVRLLGG